MILNGQFIPVRLIWYTLCSILNITINSLFGSVPENILDPFSSSFLCFGCSMLVGQRHMKLLTSICPSVCPSLSFLKIGSLAFSDIVHNDSWPGYLATDGPRFKKNNLEAWIWAKSAKIGPKTSFFAIFSSLLVFLEIASNESLQQSLTSSRGKIH